MRLLLLFILLTNCTQPTRVFNRDDEQDASCYGKYGGQWGYCDKRK